VARPSNDRGGSIRRDAVTRFVSEPVKPEAGSGDVGAMSRGEPGLPRAFTWRGTRYEVASVEATRRSTGTDRGDVYVRKHFYEILTT